MFSQILRSSRSTSLRAFSTAQGQHASFGEIGSKRFTNDKLQAAVSADTYAAYNQAKADGTALSKAQQKEISSALLSWALAQGCTNFAHWYHPMRTRDSRSAPSSKHDSFIDLDFGSSELLKPIVAPSFNHGLLFQGETDGSSYPNAGMRATNTAAAYTGWDMSSAPFIRMDTLYLPSAFLTYNGDAMCNKTPLLRATQAIQREGVRLLRHLGDNDSKAVVSNVGCEQEYFVVDMDDFNARPDLISSGRALFGALSPRNQEGCENYFGTPVRRTRAFFTELREELWKLGISCVVNHNEVAPGQLELSPIFSLSSTAADDNVLMMEVMDWISTKHGLKILFHEKPFAGVNGSGKHNNWGLNTDTGKNLLAPGKTAESQAEFTTFVAALTYALHKHGDVIRAGIAVPGNDHRLGAQEAPPAIISLYTGANLYGHLENVMAGGELSGINTASKIIPTGTPAVADLTAALDDRNRTAPFPFCGNRFEFRAVGSSQHIGQPLAHLDTCMADGLAYLSDLIEGGLSPRDAVAKVLNDHKAVIFNGDGYSAEWPIEAAQRGLLNNRNCVDAWRDFDQKKNVDLFGKFGVYAEHEVTARKNLALGDYANTLLIEGQVAARMAQQMFIPALAKDLATYSGASAALAGDRPNVYAAVADRAATLDQVLEAFPHDGDELEQADYCLNSIKEAALELREVVDAAEVLCESSLWPVPSYEDMLLSVQNDASPNHLPSIYQEGF
jgi:glutamine synthetase